MITQKRLHELVNYDPDTGTFTAKVARRPCTVGKILGTKTPKGYLVIGIDNKIYRAHRLAWLYMYGEHPKNQIDHINGVRNDNRIINLRDVIPRWNSENQHKAPKNSKTGHLGVSWCKQKNKYRSYIVVNGKQQHVGFFEDKHDAAKAYQLAKIKLHKGYTNNKQLEF